MFRGKVSYSGSHLWNFLLAGNGFDITFSQSIRMNSCFLQTILAPASGAGVWLKPGILNSWVWVQTPTVPGPCQWSPGVHPPPTLFHHCRDMPWACPEPWCFQAPSESGACTSSLVENPSKVDWTWFDTSLIWDQAMLFSCLVPLCLLNAGVAGGRQI